MFCEDYYEVLTDNVFGAFVILFMSTLYNYKYNKHNNKHGCMQLSYFIHGLQRKQVW